MDELQKGMDIALHGPAADAALRDCRAQLELWGLTMPGVAPLVLDFGLGDFRRAGEIEFWVANELEAGYCGKFLFVFAGQTCPLHHHRTKHETFFVVKGNVRMTLGAAVQDMGEGAVLPVPPGQTHSFTGSGAALLLEVSRPCVIEDNYFADTAIPIGGNWKGRVA